MRRLPLVRPATAKPRRHARSLIECIGDLRKAMAAAEELRAVWCEHYSACLDHACDKGWSGWDCVGCVHKDKAVAPSPETHRRATEPTYYG